VGWCRRRSRPARALALQPAGKLVVAGLEVIPFPIILLGDARLARYGDTGAPDPGFGTNGGASSHWDDHSEAMAMALQADGRIVVAGLVGDVVIVGSHPGLPVITNLRMAVARYFAGTCGDANQELGEQCDDGNVAAGDCCSPACNLDPTGTVCDDGQSDLCTAPDACDGAGSCVAGGPVQCPPCETCNLMNGCEVAVLPACKTPVVPGAARLALTNDASPAKDRVQWKWSKGAATAVGDFGTPNTSDDYDLCIFDATSQLAMSAALPAGGLCNGKPCWKPVSKGFRYHDRDALPGGITGALLKAGDAGKAKVSVDGKGGNLVLPDLSMLSLPLRVQLQAGNGQCWEATYSSTGVSQNDGERFKARSD
jgi:cysteine-rich repeat protein